MGRKYVIAFDGACEPVNPGGVASWGYTVTENGKEIMFANGVFGEGAGMTNNVAEYTALVTAMRALRKVVGKGDSVRIQGDSQLVIRHLKGEYKVRAVGLRPLYLDAVGLIGELTGRGVTVEFAWVPREENERADTLSHQAYEKYRARRMQSSRK
jgi:ribonuclease HI